VSLNIFDETYETFESTLLVKVTNLTHESDVKTGPHENYVKPLVEKLGHKHCNLSMRDEDCELGLRKNIKPS